MNNQEILQKAFSIVETKGEKYNSKFYHNWVCYVNKENNIVSFNSDETFCEDCIDKKLDEIQKDIDKKEIAIPEDFIELCYQTVTSPEGDDFRHCDMCGEIIEQDILWTNQEMNHWLKDMSNDDWENLDSEYNYYELMEILNPYHGSYDKYPEETLQISEKVIKYLDKE